MAVPPKSPEESKQAVEAELEKQLALALIEAIEKNDEEMVKHILKQPRGNPNAINAAGKSALTIAIFLARGSKPLVREKVLSLLIDGGAELSPPELLNELMIVAANQGMMKVFRALHDRKVDLSQPLKVPPPLTEEQLFGSKGMNPNIPERAKAYWLKIWHEEPPYMESGLRMLAFEKKNVLDIAIGRKEFYLAKLLHGYGIKSFGPDFDLKFMTEKIERMKKEPLYREVDLQVDPTRAHKLAKYLIIGQDPLHKLKNAPAHSVFEIIASRVFVEDQKQREEVLAMIKQLSENPAHHALLKTFATYLLENKRGKVIFINSPMSEYSPATEGDTHGTTSGYYNLKNTLVITVPPGSNANTVRGTVIHEIGHFVRNIVHKNESQPYPPEDEERKRLFEVAIWETLRNVRKILPGNPTSVDNPEFGTYFFAKKLFKIPNREDGLMFWELDLSGVDESIKKVVKMLAEVYGYKMVSEHREFVVRYNQLQEELGNDHPALKLLAPLYEYIQKVENPLFNAYVEKSKTKGQVLPFDQKLKLEGGAQLESGAQSIQEPSPDKPDKTVKPDNADKPSPRRFQ